MVMRSRAERGGSSLASAGYFEGVRALCDEYGILLCADEVITGFGAQDTWLPPSARHPPV